MSAPAGGAALRLAFGLRFEDLYSREGLAGLDRAFVDWLCARDPVLAERLDSARRQAQSSVPEPLTQKDEAALLVDLAPQVDAFVETLFGIEEAAAQLRACHDELAPLYKAKWKFVKRQALLTYPPKPSRTSTPMRRGHASRTGSADRSKSWHSRAP